MSRYVDGFIVPVPKNNLQAYRKLSEQSGKVWKEFGALEFIECVADDVKPGKQTSFPQAVQLGGLLLKAPDQQHRAQQRMAVLPVRGGRRRSCLLVHRGNPPPPNAGLLITAPAATPTPASRCLPRAIPIRAL